jgi:protein kinase-like protein/ankyrin repeat protein
VNSPEPLPPLPATRSGEAQPSPRAAALPQQIGRYRILGLLGAGGMGAVYRAVDPQLDREVALKQPHFDGPAADVKRRMERFQREARAAAGVLHPHVCPIFDVGEHEGRPFVVMALVEGQSLAQYLASHPGPLDVGEAVRLTRQVLDGLGAVHRRGTVHRDIKPGNILLDGAGRPFLSDFGLARPETPGTPFTSEGVIVGTPFYMAPEQAAGHSDQVGPWTDLYALGVVLYEMLTGVPPFRAAGAAVLAQILRDEPVPPRTMRPALHLGLEAIVLRAMHKDPGQRFPDAATFAEALAPWASPVTLAATGSLALPAADAPASTTTEPIREDQPRSSPRGPGISRLAGWLGGGLLVAAGMALLALVVLGALQGGWLWTMWCSFPAVLLFWFGFFGVWHETEKGHTPEGLLRGASSGNAALARRALANGVPPDGRDEMDETALMHAAARGHTEIVKLLLVHGADPALRNRFGQTARDLAQVNGRSDVVALLGCATAPTGVARAPLPRFAPRIALVAAALVGASMTIVLFWLLDPGPPIISGAAYWELRQQHLVKSVTVIRNYGEEDWLEGEVTTLDNPAVRQWGLTQRTFALPLKDAPDSKAAGNLASDGVRLTVRTGGESLRAPLWWQALIMLAVPVAVAVVIGRILSPVRLLIGKD